MPFNYGTAGSIRDPRMAYAPRQVDGVTAFWQANPGRMVDTQTGMPLSERLAMIRGQQPPQRDYVYGDSYGQIQGQEQAIEQAAFNRALALEQLRRQDQARADARNDRSAMFSQQQQLRRDQLLENARRNRDIQDSRLMDFNLALDREANLNTRAANSIKAANARALLKARKSDDGEKSDLYGDAFASEFSDILSRQSELENQLAQDDKEDSELSDFIGHALSSGAIEFDEKGEIYKPGKGVDNAGPLVGKANDFLRSGGKAAKTAAELRQINSRANSLLSAMRTKGFYTDLENGVIAQGDKMYRVDIPGPRVVQQAPTPNALTGPKQPTLPQLKYQGTWRSK